MIMKKQTVFIRGIVCCFISSVVYVRAEGQCSGGTNDLSIGERTWAPISNGVLFVDGRYIPPPYVVSRKEGLVFVNNHQIVWTFQWPPKEPPFSSPPKEMPVMPSSITEKTTKYDKNYLSYVYDVQQYLTSRYGETQGIIMMAEVYQGMPCVRSAKFGNSDSNTLEVSWMNGAHSNIRLTPMPVGKLNITKEQAESFIDKTAEIFVRGLSNGDYYMLEGGGPSRSGLWGGAQQIFLPLAAAMRGAKDEADFLAIMKTNQPPGGMSEKTLRSFYKYKDEVPEWERRLRGCDDE
jgi:hypothetical protein